MVVVVSVLVVINGGGVGCGATKKGTKSGDNGKDRRI